MIFHPAFLNFSISTQGAYSTFPFNNIDFKIFVFKKFFDGINFLSILSLFKNVVQIQSVDIDPFQ